MHSSRHQDPLPHPFSSDSNSDRISYTQSGSASPDHYHDIESLTLTLGKTRPGRKTSKDKRQSSIWTDSLENKSSTLKQPKPKIASSTPTNPKPKSKKGEQATKDLSENKTFLENPLLTTDKNWSLPRVELWCRDPNCEYNQRMWYHYRNQNCPGFFPGGIIPEVEEVNENYQTTGQTRSNYSRGSNSVNSHNHEASTMVLNAHRSNQKAVAQNREQMHLNMSMGINNFGSKEGITITHTNTNSKAENTFTNRHPNANPSGGKGTPNKRMMTMTSTDTMGSSITSNSNTDTTMLTIHTGSSVGGDESPISPEGSSASTFITGFDTTASITGSGSGSSTGSIPSKPVDPDIVNGNPKNSGNGHDVYNNHSTVVPFTHQGFRTQSASSPNSYCPNCSGVVPLNHIDNGSDIGLGSRTNKGDPGFWQFNKFQHPLQRDHSFHSVGGFTLNGQYNTIAKKHTMVKFCSSHKISLVVSTFSLMVTIGLLITLFLMKKRGMMDTMMDS